MDPNQILYPVFGLAGLTFVVLIAMAIKRNLAVARRQMPVRYYRTYNEGEELPELRVFTRNYSNLFEAPILFYVGAIMAYVTGQVTPALVIVAWTYVALRCAHSLIHLTYNNIMHRFMVFGVSLLVLLLFYAALLMRLLGS